MAFGINERLAILITADGQGAVRELEKVGKTADRELGKADASTARLAAQLTKAGAAFLTFGGLAAAGLFKAAQASGDLNEAVNLTERIFGDAADEIGRFAEGAAAIGQSERAAREATATFGGLLQNLGMAQRETVDWSIGLTKLASDLGSAFNKEPAIAVQAIGSALRGETEPIRQFNVMLDDATVRAKAVEMGLAATTAEVDKNGKAQATLALILEQTNALQGDFAATADGAANASRVLSAEWENMQAKLGQAALPVLEKGIGALTSMVQAFSSLDDATGGMVSTLALFVTGGALAVGTLATLTGWVLKLKMVQDGLGGTKFAAMIGTWGPTLGVAAAAVGVTAIAIHEMGSASREAAKLVSELTGSMRQAGDASGGVLAFVNQAVQEFPIWSRVLDEAGVSTGQLTAAVVAGGPAWAAMRQDLGIAGQAAGLSELEMLALRGSIDALAIAVPKSTEALATENRILSETVAAAGLATEATNTFGRSADLAAADSLEYTRQLALNQQALDDEANAAAAAADALDNYVDSVLSALNSDIAYERQAIRTSEALEATTKTLGEAEAGTREWESALLDGKSAALDQAAAAVRLAEDTAKANGETLTAQERQRVLVAELAAVAATLAVGSPLRQQLLGYIATLGIVPPSVRTVITADGVVTVTSAVRNLIAAYGQVPKGVSTKITSTTEGRGITQTNTPSSGGSSGSVPFFARGGVMPRMGPAISADGHRLAGLLPGEIVVNPSNGGGLGDLAAAMGRTSTGGSNSVPASIVVNVNAGAVANPRELRDLVYDAVREANRLHGDLRLSTTGRM